MRAFIRFALFAACLLFGGNAHSAARFAVCVSTCTWDNSSTLMWSASSGGATGASAPTASDDVTLDANTCVGGVACTITPNANISILSLTDGACTGSTTGCILDASVNNNNFAIGGGSTLVNISGTGTRTIRMGSGTWTITALNGGPNIWTATTTTGLTFTPGTSTLVLNCTAGTGINDCTFVTGSLTYATVTLNSGKAGMVITGNPTFANMNITAPTEILFFGSGNTTVTNAFNFVGTASNPILLTGNGLAAQFNLSVATGTPTMSFVGLRGVVCTGGATFSATNSFDFGGNSGCNITGPTTGGGGRIIGG